MGALFLPVVWGGRDLADGAGLGLVPILVADGSLVPRADVVGLCWAELFVGFAGYGPVNAADQELAVLGR